MHLIIGHTIGIALLSAVLFLPGCSSLQSAVDNTNHYRLTPAQVTGIAEKYDMRRCPEGKKAVVAGSEVRSDGSLDLIVGCK